MRFSMIVRPFRSVSFLLVAGFLLGASNATAVAQSHRPLSSIAQTLVNVPGNVLTGPTAVVPTVEQPSDPAVAETTVRLVLNLTKRRVYVYQDDQVISSYPVAIGKPGWETPVGEFKVLNMEMNPTFKSFKSGRIIPPGPDNPLGVRWISIWTDGKTQLGFHGTNQPELIGQAVSHGCIRMHNRDVVKLYAQVKPGVAVTVVP